MQGDQEQEEERRRRRRKLVLCIIYSIMILGAIISLPFLVMVVGSSSSKVVNNNNQNQSGHLSPSSLEMVYKREVTGNGHQHQELKARFTPPRMKEQTSSNDPELNTISNHHHQQQSFSSLSPSSSSLETTFINEQLSSTLLSLPSSLESAPLQLSSSSLHSLSLTSSSSLHHSPRRRRRKKKRIRTESNEEEIESNTESTYNMNTNLIEDNTNLNLTTISFLPITSSPSPLVSSSSLSLSSLSSPISSSSSQSNVNEDYIIKSINQNKRTSSSIQVNTKMNKLFTAKYYYLYNRCSGGKVQIMGTRKVSASAPLLPSSSSTSGQSQSIPSSSLSSSSFSNPSPFPHHSRHRRHHSLLYTLHHQEQVPVSFSTSGDLLDDDYGKRKICVYTNITSLLVTFFDLFSSRLVPVFLPYLLSLFFLDTFLLLSLFFLHTFLLLSFFFLDTFLSLSLVASLSLCLIIPLPLVWNIPVYLSVAFTLHTCFYFPSFWVRFILCVSCTRRKEGRENLTNPPLSFSNTLLLTFSSLSILVLGRNFSVTSERLSERREKCQVEIQGDDEEVILTHTHTLDSCIMWVLFKCLLCLTMKWFCQKEVDL